jgi:hypothetical protein
MAAYKDQRRPFAIDAPEGANANLCRQHAILPLCRSQPVRRYQACRAGYAQRMSCGCSMITAEIALLLVENLHREDLNAADEANAILRLEELMPIIRAQQAKA